MFLVYLSCYVFFFFNDTATTEIYTLSLHDALPISAGDTFRAAAIEQLKVWGGRVGAPVIAREQGADAAGLAVDALEDRKSTRLKSSHANISYAVFCLKKKKKTTKYNEEIQHI